MSDDCNQQTAPGAVSALHPASSPVDTVAPGLAPDAMAGGSAPPPAAPPGRTLNPAQAKAMGALMCGLSLACLDLAIANTALPAMAANLHSAPAESVWIINAYQLAMVATMLPFAALGDKIGLKRVFVGGLITFTVASLLCALSPSLLWLTLARILQGLGGSAVMTVNFALIRFIYPANRLGRGVGLNALVAGVSMALGPTVASLVLSVAHWPWLFALNLPIGIAATFLAIPYLPSPPNRGVNFDIVALLLNGLGFAAVLFGFIEFSQQAPASLFLTSLLIGVGALVLLVRREAHHPAPMLPTDLFRRPAFALTSATALCAFSVQGLAFVSLPFYFETVLGRDQIQTGFLLTPWSLMVAVVAPFAGRLSDRYPPPILGGIGLFFMFGSLLSVVWMPTDVSSLGIMIRMALCGLGFGFFQSPNLKAFMSSAPAERSGSASAIVGTSRLLGQSSGSALVALSFGMSGHHGPLLALVWGAVFAFIGGIASFSRLLDKKIRHVPSR